MIHQKLRLWALGSSLIVGGIGACAIASNVSTPVPPSQSTPTQPIAAAVGFRQTVVLRDLERPWSMAWLPDGAMLITEKVGRLRLVQDGKLQPEPIAGLPEVFSGGQGGLMDVSLHPQFATNRLIYLTYAHGNNAANRTRVARAKFDGKALTDLKVIFEVAQTKSDGQHFGSRIAWLADGTMLIAIGDGGNPPTELDGKLIRFQAQNRRSHLGKILRLKDDGSVPQDNPLVGQKDVDIKIWSYGHRNIQGLVVEPKTQRIWASEHGSKGGDELNAITAGQNYGWPLVTHSEEYTGGEISPDRSRPGMADPKVVWTPAIAPSGLAFYDGDRLSAWRGDLFAGGLVGKQVRRIDLDEAGQVMGEEKIAIGQRVRDIRQSPDGLLYILTDETNGQLIRLEPTKTQKD
jgi:aldose sugar dehydrogenase